MDRSIKAIKSIYHFTLGFSYSTVLLYVLVFLFSLHHPLDFDLGWHLKYGEYALQHHTLLHDNIFSTEMPDYHYTNTAWGTDIVTYMLFQQFGFLGISLLGAILITLSFFCLDKAAHMTNWERVWVLSLLSYVMFPLIANSFRGQFFSILGLSLLYLLFERYEHKPSKKIFLSIPLFMVWVNLHGQFVMGVVLLMGWTIAYVIRLYGEMKNKVSSHTTLSESIGKRIYLYLNLIGVFIATLINPYGIEMYRETFNHTNNQLRELILEWKPVQFNSAYWWSLVFFGFLIAINVIILFHQKKIAQYIFFIIVCVVLLVISFPIHRYMWIFFPLSVPMIVPVFQAVKPEKRYVQMSIIIGVYLLAATYVAIGFWSRDLSKMNWETYCLQLQCPTKAVNFLVAHPPKGKLLSFYDWGGWLIWSYPQVKPSIDGRMAFWQDEHGYNALAKYFLITNNLQDIQTSKYDAVFMPYSQPIFFRIKQLVQEKKWVILYDDNQAYIAVRKK
jgi:hypothetical protein